MAAGLVLDKPEAPPSASATDVMKDLFSALERLRVAFATPTSGLGAPGPAEEDDKDMEDADVTERATPPEEAQTPPTKRLRGFVAASQKTTAHVNKPVSLVPVEGRPGYFKLVDLPDLFPVLPASAATLLRDVTDKGHTESLGGASPTFPWMQDTPERLRLRLRWTPRPVPESSKPSLILLYAGKDDAGALDAPTTRPSRSTFGQWTWRSWTGHAGRGALLYDVLHGHGGQGRLCGGRPQLQDVEHSQMVPKTGWPVRGRAEQTLWGLEDLDPSAARCSSIWVTRAYIQWANALHHSLIKFDECRLGQVVVKTDLPLHHWHDLRCNHGAHPRGEKLNSSDLSRYPEQMMQGLAAAILRRAGPVLEVLRPGGTVPQANPTTPPRRQGEPSPSAPGDNKRLKAGQQALAGLTLGSLPVSASDNPEVRTPTQPAGGTVELRGGTLSPGHAIAWRSWIGPPPCRSRTTQISPTRSCTSRWPSNSAP